MRRVRLALVLGVCAVASFAVAQGTKLWTVDRYDSMEEGSAENVAIRSDGRLEPGPVTSLVDGDAGNYVWTVAADAAGNSYAGVGGTAVGSARVLKISAGGKTEKIFEGKELGVQALRVGEKGFVFVATSPDGTVYRIAPGSATAAVVFDAAATEEKPKYLWDIALGRGGEMYVAAGAPAVVYRVPAGGGKAETLFKTTDQHIRCLALGGDGTLWAGSDGSGVVYRISTTEPGAKPFAAYAAPHREITSLALDEHGSVFAAAVGGKGPSALSPLPVTGNVGVTVTFAQPGSTAAAGANPVVPEGSEIYRIAADGTPEKLLTLKDEVVYALAVRNGSLLAATGNRGRVYRVDTQAVGRFTAVAHFDAAQATAFAATKGGLLVGTSNSGKVFRLGDAVAKTGMYTSEVFDAAGYSQWGHAEVRGTGGYALSVRTGNVESPLMGWSDWVAAGKAGEAKIPAGRFAQWRAELQVGAVESVALNYLPRNIAPVVDEIVVQPGARVAPTAQTTVAIVQVLFPAGPGSAPVFVQDANTAPLAAQKDKTAITVRWAAHDDNGDEMLFSVWYRGVGEANWRLLKEKLTDRFYSFDSALLPDGGYEMKVSASDAPDHTSTQALVGSKTSEVFVVDTTPPVPGALEAKMEGGQIHAKLTAHDAISPIAHAEYSVDAEKWQYLEPVGKVSDAQTESYDFVAPVPPVTEGVTDLHEHVLAVRVYDRYDNVAAVKTLVR